MDSFIFTRRDFLKTGALAASTTFFPLLGFPLRAQAQGDPHYFLQVILPGGADSSYLFDARPLAMTKAGLIQNYLDTEPKEWLGKNGTSAWASPITDPLRPYQADFSILNGLVMSPTDDGHDQNMNYFFTGNSFGGEAFLPQVARTNAGFELDFLQLGELRIEATNIDRSVSTEADSAVALPEFIRKNFPMPATPSALQKYLAARYAANSGGSGLFSQRVKDLGDSLARSRPMAEKLSKFESQTAGTDRFGKQLQVVKNFFLQGLAPAGLITFDDDFDTHAADQAKLNPEKMRKVVANLETLIRFFKTEPYDARRKLIDVTTILVTSEFSRTMRQSGKPITYTGTDHNALNNQVIILGKGIQGGLVIGASDREDEKAMVSEAHQALDKENVKIMGKPFDFAKEMPSAESPKVYEAKKYLNMGSVMNTVFKSFDMPTSIYRRFNPRETATYPVLQSLIKT